MDAYRMIYAGSVAAMLPGLGLGLSGVLGFVIAAPLAALMLIGYTGIRAGLKNYIWYRWFLSAIFASTFAFGALCLFAPEQKAWAGLVWLLVFVFLLGGFYPYFEGYRPPDNERVPRG